MFLLIVALLAATPKPISGTYVGSQMCQQDRLTLSVTGQAVVFAKPATWHARAGVIHLEGDRRVSWSVINRDSLALAFPDGLMTACRVAAFTNRREPIPDTRGSGGDWEIATAYTCQLRNRPATLKLKLDGTAELCRN